MRYDHTHHNRSRAVHFTYYTKLIKLVHSMYELQLFHSSAIIDGVGTVPQPHQRVSLAIDGKRGGPVNSASKASFFLFSALSICVNIPMRIDKFPSFLVEPTSIQYHPDAMQSNTSEICPSKIRWVFRYLTVVPPKWGVHPQTPHRVTLEDNSWHGCSKTIPVHQIQKMNIDGSMNTITSSLMGIEESFWFLSAAEIQLRHLRHDFLWSHDSAELFSNSRDCNSFHESSLFIYSLRWLSMPNRDESLYGTKSKFITCLSIRFRRDSIKPIHFVFIFNKCRRKVGPILSKFSLKSSRMNSHASENQFFNVSVSFQLLPVQETSANVHVVLMYVVLHSYWRREAMIHSYSILSFPSLFCRFRNWQHLIPVQVMMSQSTLPTSLVLPPFCPPAPINHHLKSPWIPSSIGTTPSGNLKLAHHHAVIEPQRRRKRWLLSAKG